MKDSAEPNVVWGAKEAPVKRPLTRGIHHLAFNTDDLRNTLDFYVRVLGMPIVHGLLTGGIGNKNHEKVGNPPFGGIPHYFLDMGGDSLMAFFEYPKDQMPKANRNAIAAMQHCAFVASPKRFRELHERLIRNGVEIVYGPHVVIEPNIQSMYFFDPNGIRLEITADLDGDEEDLGVVRSCLFDRERMRGELQRVSDDPQWIESMLDNLAENQSPA
jgi:catechol 2,3-dioxygenase-like lactoylglutathione lyase family enzyme